MDVSPIISYLALDSTFNHLIASWNRGRGRVLHKGVMERGIRVHRSVRTRIEEKKYLPKIRFAIDDRPRRLTREEWLARDPEHFEWVD